MYQNVRGLNSKLDYFRLNLLCSECDVAAVTETFLTETVEDAELVWNGWSVARRDRATGARGGGVLIAARPGLVMRRLIDLETPEGEDLWVSFTLDQVSFYVSVVYIPPNASDEIYMRWFETVEQVIDTLNGVVIIIGDLNLNPLYTSHNILCYYCYFLNVCGLTEMNEVTNAHGGKLDVVLVSERIRGASVLEIEGGGLVPRRDAYHPPLEILLPIDKTLVRPCSERIDPSNMDLRRDWQFAKGNYELLYKLVAETSWQEVLESEDIVTAVDIFYKIIYDIFDACIPMKTRSRRVSRRFPVWFTADLITDITLKAGLHRKWKTTKCKDVYNEFARLRTDIKKRITLAYQMYVDRIQGNIKSDPRSFWRHIDSLKSKGGFVSEVTFGGKQFVGAEVATAFSEFFAGVFLPDIPCLDMHRLTNDSQMRSANYININSISMHEVEAGIKRLKPDSSVGPDNFPAFIVKGCMEQLKVPIHFMYNLALSTGLYPHQWKVTRVRPIPKSKDSTKVEDHRPIAVLSTLAKLFESILHRTISAQIRPFLGDSQHGFRTNRSVDTNLLTLVDAISENLDRGIQVDVVYFDFKKAFDRVDNDILLSKLNNIGFTPKLLSFFASYLRDRQQYVKHGCFVSKSYHTRSGVSQGSILGPLLFGIMINDLESVVKHARCLLYADDLKLVYRVENLADCEYLQRDIASVVRWSIENKLLFNTAKCCVCTFSRSFAPLHAQYFLGVVPIDRVFSVRDLGVVFDTHLTFHEHIRTLAEVCFRRLGFVIRNCKDFYDLGAIKLVFNALVRSKIEASSVVWNPYECTYALILEKIQKAFLRFAYKKMYGYYPFLYPTKFLLGTLGYNSLEVRRNNNLLLTMCKILRGESDCLELVGGVVRLFVPDVPRIALRPRLRPLLAVPAARTVSRKNSPLPRALRLLNALLTSAPDCDLFASLWSIVCRECLTFCELMDDRQSSVFV